MTALPSHGLPLPDDATAEQLAAVLGLKFGDLRLRVLSASGRLLDKNRPISRDEAAAALGLFGLAPAGPANNPPSDLATLAAMLGVSPSEVIQAVHRKHRTFIPSNRPLTESEMALVRSSLGLSAQAEPAPDRGSEMDELEAQIEALAKAHRQEQQKSRGLAGSVAASNAEEPGPGGKQLDATSSPRAEADCRVSGGADEWLVAGDVPAHGLPLPAGAKVRDLADLMGRNRYQFATDLRLEDGEVVLPTDALTAEIAQRALAPFGLTRVLTLSERRAARRSLPALAAQLNVAVADILSRVHQAKQRFLPTNRPLTDEELALLGDLYPALSLDASEPESSGRLGSDFTQLAAKLQDIRAETEDAQSSQEPPPPVEDSTLTPVAHIPSQRPSESVEEAPPTAPEHPVLRDYRRKLIHYWQLPEDVRADPAHAETIERIRESRIRPWDTAGRIDSDRERFNDIHCPPAHRRKILDRYLSDTDRDPWLMRHFTWPDAALAELYLEHDDPGGIVGSCVWTRRLPEPLRTRLAERGLELLLAHPEQGGRHEAEGVYAALGTEAGLALIERDREANTGRDPLAEGVGIAWSGTEDAVFWKLLDFPRARPRRPLTCLRPARGSMDRHGGTLLDPTVPVENRDKLRDVVLPILLVDRDKEVRRRAKIARALCDLPWGVIVSFEPPFRALREYAVQYRTLLADGREDEFEFEDDPDPSPSLTELGEQLNSCYFQEEELTKDLLHRALDVILDEAYAPAHRDQIEASLLRASSLNNDDLCEMVERGRRDTDLLWQVVHHRRKDRLVLRAALEAQPEDLGVLGAVVRSKEARDDWRIRSLLQETSEPHILLVLARARVPGMAHRAMEALLENDPVRALSLAEELGKVYRLEVTREQWARVLAHPIPQVRERAMLAVSRRDVHLR